MTIHWKALDEHLMETLVFRLSHFQTKIPFLKIYLSRAYSSEFNRLHHTAYVYY
jgi:hypothetical protein